MTLNRLLILKYMYTLKKKLVKYRYGVNKHAAATLIVNFNFITTKMY